MKISHVGIGNGVGLPFALKSTLAVAPGTQAAFMATNGNKLAMRTSTQGECELCTAGNVAVGVIVDCSPKGTSVTVEKGCFEWVKYSGSAPAVSGFVCVQGTAGLVETVAITDFVDGIAVASPTSAQLRSGVWQVDQVDTTATMVLIDLESRL